MPYTVYHTLFLFSYHSKFQKGDTSNDPIIAAKYFKLLKEFCKWRQASRLKISDTFLALIVR